jgi:dihydropyrimidinase
MFDLLITGGKIVSPDNTIVGDVAVKKGKVVAVTQPGVLTSKAVRTIDATDKYVVPGGVDAHVHFRMGFPPIVTQDYDQGTIAAAYGGTTTVIDFAIREAGASPLQSVKNKISETEGKLAIDYSCHCLLTGKLAPADIEELGDVIALGVPSIKVMMIYFDWPPGDGGLYAMLEEVAKHGGIGVVHAENQAMQQYFAEKLISEGKTSGRFIEASRPGIVEEEAVRRAIFLAKKAGAGLFVLHNTYRGSVEAIAEARAKGQAVYGETCHNYLCFTNDDLVNRENGLRWSNFPPLRHAEDQAKLWQALISGSLQVVSTDDFTFPAETRDTMGQELPDIECGHNGAETRVPVLFSEGVSKGRMSINRFVEIFSTNAAKIYGLYPQKGTIAPGSDADIVLIDPDLEKTIKLEDLHTVDYSIWDDFEVKGVPIMTISRGKIIVENGTYVGQVGDGRFVKRKIDPQIIDSACIY